MINSITARCRVIGWAFLCLLLSTPLQAADFRFKSIRVPESVATSARGINARGDIVGNYEGRDGITHGFLLHEEAFTTIDFPGSMFTGAKGINARGDIVGNFTDAQDREHTYLLSEGQYTQIDYPGAGATIGLGINNAGDITGRWYNDEGTELGFLLKNGTFHRVRVPDSALTSVSGAQDNGMVLVGDTILNYDGVLRGFVRPRPGHYELIVYPGPEPVEFTVLRWINQRGDIVGVSGSGDESSWFGFLRRDGQYTRIDVDFAGATTTRPLAINDDGVIVGDYINQRGQVRGFRAVPLETSTADSSR